MIAVADPLWMFVPPEFLSAEQLSVPVMTWIDGVPHVGDLAHEHEHEHEHEIDHDHDHDHEFADQDERLAESHSLAAPLIFGAPSMQLNSMCSVDGLTQSVSSWDSQFEMEWANAPLSVERSGYVAIVPLATEDSFAGIETDTDNDLQGKFSGSMFAAFDRAFANSDNDAWSEF